MVPDRVVKDYDDCMETLEKISDGKKNVDLPSLLDDEEAIITTRRWGSQTARSHGDE